MPRESVTKYTCAVTGEVQYGNDLPPKWFMLEEEVFSPEAQTLIVAFAYAHQGIAFTDLMASLRSNPVSTVKAIKARSALPKE